MVSAAGLLLSTSLGAAARKLQVELVNRSFGTTATRVNGYLLSIGAFVGTYLVLDKYVDNNRSLLKRRLLQLREQRAQTDAFLDLSDKEDERMTASERSGKFFRMFEHYGQGFK